MPVPSEIKANFNLDFTVENVASLVTSGYTPKFVLAGTSTLVDSGTVDGDDIDFTLTAAQTAAFATGQYTYQVIAENGLGGRIFIEDGVIWVRGAVATSGAQDFRSVAKQVLDAIDAMIAGKATADQQAYVIQSQLGSRSLTRHTMADLLQARQVYAQIVAAEDRDLSGSSLFRVHTFSPQRVG